MLKGSFSEEEGEDVVVEIVRYEGALETYVTQRFDLVCELGVGISVYDRDLIPLGAVDTARCSHDPPKTSIPRIDDARVLHLDVRRRLKVDVLRHPSRSD
jgi:hypothetical protein